jgi:hypothetical protein
MKKRLFAAFLAAVFSTVGVGAASVSAATPPQTDVTGVITTKGTPVVGATVTAECGGAVEVDTTNAQGAYLVVFNPLDCPFGSTVKVTAKKGGQMGSSSGTVQGVTTKLNIAIVNVSIPEFGTMAGLLASGLGVGAILYTRRRQTFMAPRA